jgi:REP element-mobilizing transposase RayT
MFTNHGYQTWLPDREEGFVEHHREHNYPDLRLATAYRTRAKEDVVIFDDEHQRAIIEAVLDAAPHQRFRAHFVATESTHAHVLVSWPDDRKFMTLRTSIKSSITRRLNQDFQRQRWLEEGASRRQVNNQEHFDYLIVTYLPEHRGWKWNDEKKFFR